VSPLQRIQKIIQNNGTSPKFMNISFKKFDFIIEKGLMLQFVARCISLKNEI
jgi:hypothetical protein